MWGIYTPTLLDRIHTMSDNSTTEVWHSGDWKSVPLNKPPYNGIEISAIPTYDTETEKFVSATVTFTDFTLSKTGVSSTIPELTIAEQWVPVPKAIKISSPPASPPDQSNPSFTIDGNVCLETTTSGIFLRIHLFYGMEHSTREELGFILKFDQVKQK